MSQKQVKVSVEERARFSKVWRDEFLVSGMNSYDHEKILTNMIVDESPQQSKRLKSAKSHIDQGRELIDGDYEYDDRWGYILH